MSKTNVKIPAVPVYTAEGAIAARITPELQLRRSVLACLLFENNAYEEGKAIADRIVELCGKVAPEKVAALAIEARHEQHLRHAPLLLLKGLVRHGHGKMVADTIERVITRADELSEFVSLYWDGKNRKMLPSQMKKGLARAFCKFNEHSLQKYNRDAAVKLRDTLFLCHAKPKDEAQAALWKRLVDGELATPETWEVMLSSGKDKKATFERLIGEGKLGYLATLRNLRGMLEAGCDLSVVKQAILDRKGAERVLPFRYVAAARAAPKLEGEIDKALIAAMSQLPKLPGKTVLVVDVSGSMGARLSGKSEMTRMDVAGALAAIVVGQCEDPVVYATAGSDTRRIHDTSLLPSRPGMAMVDAIKGSAQKLGGGGIFLTQALSFIKAREHKADRIIVLTDEQDCEHDPLKKPENADAFGTFNYLLNISNEKNGIGYKPKFVHIDGWSDNIIRYIYESERLISAQ